MQKYPKIQTLFKRCTEKGPDKNKLILGDWTLPEFKALRNVAWEATEKVDGTNISVHWDGERVSFYGRDESAQIPATLVNWLIQKFTKDVMRAHDMPEMVIFGEGFGAGIQKVGKDYIEFGVSFSPFDVCVDGLWLERENVEDIASKLGLTPVELLHPMTLGHAIEYVSSGFKSRFGNAQAEGLVLRAPHGLLTRRGERIMTKIKTRDFTKGTIKVEDED